MKNVKRIFFLSEGEVKDLKDGYIDYQMPCFELEDGSILYGKIGYPDARAWWEELKVNE